MRNQMWLFGICAAVLFGWSGWELFKEAEVYYSLKEYGWVLGVLVAGSIGAFLSYMSLLILWVMVGAWFKQMKEGREVVSEFDFQLGNRIGFFRRLAKKAQGEVAKEIGISSSVLSRIESGHVSMSAKQFFRLVEVLNISMSDFDNICYDLDPFDGERNQ